MDPIVTKALVGTARQEQINLTTGTPVDVLISGLPVEEREIERTFLLSAGAWAIYRQAGKQAQQITSAPVPAPAEQLRACSPGAALLLARLLDLAQPELLRTAMERLHQHGQHLPYHLLPQALNRSNKEIRAALFPVLGERGRWLSQFNPSWHWVEHFLPAETNELPADAETIWQEGSPGKRAEILRRLRAVDPEQARAQLVAVWKQEKAEERNDFLATLEVGLSLADEAFLETALDDRATSVRSMAAALLTHLPASAFCERMRQRAQSMIVRNADKLTIMPPQNFPHEWQRDGMIEKPSRKVAPRSWWLIQALTLVEPAFWEAHLGAPPSDLIKMIAGDRWTMQVMEGWSRATIRHRASDWLHPLWMWWCEHYQEALEKKYLIDYTYREQLLCIMPAQLAEQLMLEKINEGASGEWWEVLSELPRPWSVELSQTYLRLLRKHWEAENTEAKGFNPYADPWYSNLPTLAQSLPVACFPEALRGWELPASETWQIQYIRKQLQELTEIIHIRQEIDKEIICNDDI